MMFSRQLMRSSLSMLGLVAIIACVVASAAQPLAAQASSDSGAMRGRMGGGGRGGNDRPKLAEFRAFYEKSLKDRVTLTDEQIVKWRAWNVRFDPRRQALWNEEGDLRRILRQQLARGVTPDEAKVGDAMDRFKRLERKRLALKEEENKDLATFLKPIQQARFFVFQDQVQREMQDMQGRREGGRGGSPSTRPDSGAPSRQGMRGDSTFTKPSRGGSTGRPPGTSDQFSSPRPARN